MNRRQARLLALLFASPLVSACGPSHIKAYTPKTRHYDVGKYAQSDASARPESGSLFSEAAPGFLQDTRALRVGDILIIRIDEQADAKGDATTKLSRQSKREAGMDALLGLAPAIKRMNPDVDPTKLLAMASQYDFAGDGATHRKGALQGSLAVRVARQMPNADLYIEGTKVVMINNEEYHLYVSGLVRLADVKTDNTVLSSRIADAQIEFTGRGDVADQQERGWMAKLIDSVNPC